MGVAWAFTACTSPAWQRMQHADGLLDFVFGSDRAELQVAVEKVSGGGGSITSAHVRAYGDKVFVSGLVGRQSPGSPPPGAHVDVIVLDAQGKVVEGIAETYLPRDIPHGQRSGFAQSRYTARLAARPGNDSTVKVVFHGVPKSKCVFGADS
jgi:hypothetical protein